MSVLASLLAVFSALGFIVGLVWLAISLIRRRSPTKAGIVVLGTFGAFVVALIISSQVNPVENKVSPTPSTSTTIVAPPAATATLRPTPTADLPP